MQLDMVMLSLEKIFGIEWDDEDENSIFDLIDKEINSHIKIKIKKMDFDDDFVDDGDDDKEEE